jgi:hypothetical protein
MDGVTMKGKMSDMATDAPISQRGRTLNIRLGKCVADNEKGFDFTVL